MQPIKLEDTLDKEGKAKLEELRKKYPEAQVLDIDEVTGLPILSKEELDDWEY